MKVSSLKTAVLSVMLLPAGFYLLGRSPDYIELQNLRAVEEPGEEFSGGETTTFDTSANAFGRTPSNLTSPRWSKFRRGKFLFERDFKTEEGASPPIGPRFSAVSCKACHFKDGRGRPPEREGESPTSMVVRLATGFGTDVTADPTYGEQLDFHGIDGALPEAGFAVRYEEIRGRFADGTGYRLLRPIHVLGDPGYGPFAGGLRISPRVAPVSFGAGLLQGIPEQQILSRADPDDRDGDGISGRPNRSIDRLTGRSMLGRFGWKASQPTVLQQVATAFDADMGITSALYPERKQESGITRYELSDARLDTITYYMTLVAPPGRRNWRDGSVLRGKAIFNSIGCESCHTAKHTTGIVPEFPEVSNQIVRPYTDLLLHDMGAALADHVQEGEASGREWRTPPLWGLGLIRTVNGHTRFLHDGRARTIEEAILWHGGEAKRAGSAYRRLRATDRSALLAFLGSL